MADKYTKQPGETRMISVDYRDWLASVPGETGTVATYSVDPGLTVVSCVYSNGFIYVKVSGGTVGQTYKLTVWLQTSPSVLLREWDILVTIRDKNT